MSAYRKANNSFSILKAKVFSELQDFQGKALKKTFVSGHYYLTPVCWRIEQENRSLLILTGVLLPSVQRAQGSVKVVLKIVTIILFLKLILPVRPLGNRFLRFPNNFN